MLFEEIVKFLLSCLGQTVELGFKGNEDMTKQRVGVFLSSLINVL